LVFFNQIDNYGTQAGTMTVLMEGRSDPSHHACSNELGSRMKPSENWSE
jgi:hypothetical protein